MFFEYSLCSAWMTRFDVSFIRSLHFLDLVPEPLLEFKYLQGFVITDDERVVSMGERDALGQIRKRKPIQIGNLEFLEILFVLSPNDDVSGWEKVVENDQLTGPGNRGEMIEAKIIQAPVIQATPITKRR